MLTSISSPHVFGRPVPEDHEGFTVLRSLATAELSVAAYQDAADFFRLTRQAGYEGSVPVAAGAALLYVSYCGADLWVTCRGSEGVGDFFADLRVIRRRWPLVPGKINAGFRSQAKGLWPRLETVVEAQAPTRIFFQGHSLGGDLALILAAAARGVGWPVESVYAHEAARAGNREWADGYRDLLGHCSHRVVCVDGVSRDIVTRSPPSRWGFAHVPTARLLTEHDQILMGEHAWQDLRKANPIPVLQALRIFTRLRKGLALHVGTTLLRRHRHHLRFDS